jgi:uncharacterized membrane protein HdeD (DUF308 family)
VASLIGVISIIAGVVVLAKPSNSLETLAVISGIFVLIDGIIATVQALDRRTESRGLLAVLGVVSVIVGIMLIRHPIAGVTAVALLLGIWMIAAAVVRLVVAVGLGEHRLRSVAGAAVLAIAGVVIVASPHIRYATLALITGLGFIGQGTAMLLLGWAMRTERHEAAPTARHGITT